MREYSKVYVALAVWRFNPETGAFTWSVSAPGITAGKPAGSVSVHGAEQRNKNGLV